MTLLIEEFTKRIDAVGDNLVFAHFHVQLCQKLSSPENREKLSSSPMFWGLTRDAHNQVGILRLCRAYEQQTKRRKHSIGLLKLLHDIQSNFHNWNDKVQLNEKQKQQLKLDLKTVDANECRIVHKLITLRDKVIAHTDKIKLRNKIKAIDQFEGRTLTSEEFSKLTGMVAQEILYDVDENGYTIGLKQLTWSDVQQLIERGIEICNRYRLLLHLPPETLDLNLVEKDLNKIFE